MVTYVTALLNCWIFIKLHVRNFNFRLVIYFNVVFINASIVSVFLKYNCCNDYLLVHKLVLVITCLGIFENFQKSRGGFIPRIARNKRHYWLITPNQQTISIETNIFTVGNYKIIPLMMQSQFQSIVWLYRGI